MLNKNKYKEKYNTTSNRLEIWNYSNVAYYFITICTKNKVNYFGEIQNGNILLSKSGELVKNNWIEIKNKYQNVKLDEFIIMPNHIHGIIFIQKKADNNTIDKDTINRDSTIRIDRFMELNPMTSLSLSTIIRWFKGKSTFEIRNKLKINNFYWQSNFYDRIIRNEKELDEIRKYIYYNPLNWENDEYKSESKFKTE